MIDTAIYPITVANLSNDSWETMQCIGQCSFFTPWQWNYLVIFDTFGVAYPNMTEQFLVVD